LLVAVAALSALARVLEVPYPIVLVIGGALLGFVPGIPNAQLDPDVVLVIFLPPLLYAASIYANYGDLRANVRALTLNTVVLVLVTMSAVAVVAHAIVRRLPWAPHSRSARSSRPQILSPPQPSCVASRHRGAL
jgi:NhaP-type Na+/H+ or K+/H+ antiporter